MPRRLGAFLQMRQVLGPLSWRATAIESLNARSEVGSKSFVQSAWLLMNYMGRFNLRSEINLCCHSSTAVQATSLQYLPAQRAASIALYTNNRQPYEMIRCSDLNNHFHRSGFVNIFLFELVLIATSCIVSQCCDMNTWTAIQQHTLQLYI